MSFGLPASSQCALLSCIPTEKSNPSGRMLWCTLIRMLMSMPKILPPKPFPAVAELKVVAASMLLIFNFDWALAERPKNRSKAHIDPVKVVFFISVIFLCYRF